MRDIRFRAWDSVNKLMVDRYEDFWLGHDGRIYIESEKQYDTPNQEISQHSGKGIILMQFTGLKDKNGKEIYEGDIITAETMVRFTVVKHIYGWGVDFESFREEGKQHQQIDSDLIQMMQENGGIEVLGNIYENPELLK